MVVVLVVLVAAAVVLQLIALLVVRQHQVRTVRMVRRPIPMERIHYEYEVLRRLDIQGVELD